MTGGSKSESESESPRSGSSSPLDSVCMGTSSKLAVASRSRASCSRVKYSAVRQLGLAQRPWLL